MLWRVGAAIGGMILFALCSHQGGLWAITAAGGLVLTAIAIGGHSRGWFGHFSGRVFLFSLAGAGLGVVAAIWHRHNLGLPALSFAEIRPFVVVACLVGAAEELLYRGWMFEQVRTAGWGWLAATVVAAVGHALYKAALFVWPASPVGTDVASLFWITATAGLILGFLRRWSDSVMPAVAAHVTFDLLVYGAVTSAPWWVWG